MRLNPPPHVSQTQLQEALARVAQRHRKADDERFALIDATNPRAVLDQIDYSPNLALPRKVLHADVYDGLVLEAWCWWAGKRALRDRLKRGRRLGWSLAELGEPLGITSRQGVASLIDRLDALLEWNRPDESWSRDKRRADREKTARTEWIAEHRERVVSVCAAVVAHLGGLADDAAASDLEEVEADLAADDWTPGTLVWLGSAVFALRTVPAVLELEAEHLAHRALHAAGQLLNDYSADLARAVPKRPGRRRTVSV